MNGSDETRRRAQGCLGRPSSLRRDLIWFDAQLREFAKRNADFSLASLAIAAGEAALRLKDWTAAKSYALCGIEAAKPKRLRVYELENTLVLRAAEAQLGNRAEAARLTSEVLSLAREVGFDKPGELGGRQDLVYFWKLGADGRGPSGTSPRDPR